MERAFSSSDISKKKDDYHGSCKYVRTTPDVASKGIKSVNIELSFEDALRLSLGIQSALISLNRYNRSTKKGREMGLVLSLKTDSNAVSVIESKVRSAD